MHASTSKILAYWINPFLFEATYSNRIKAAINELSKELTKGLWVCTNRNLETCKITLDIPANSSSISNHMRDGSSNALKTYKASCPEI